MQCIRKCMHTLIYLRNTIFIKIYLSSIIQGIEDKQKIICGSADIRTDNYSGLGMAENVNRRNYKLMSTDGTANFRNRFI